MGPMARWITWGVCSKEQEVTFTPGFTSQIDGSLVRR